MATSKFDQLVNLVSRQVIRRLEGNDKREYGSDRKTSGYSAGREGLSPENAEDALDISPELDPEIKRSILDDDDRGINQIDNERDSNYETEDEQNWSNAKERARNRKYRDGFKLMRGDED